MLWFQRSRAKWISFGDCNTCFFHGVTALRRRKYTYDTMQDDNGYWIAGTEALERLVTGFFISLFTNDTPYSPYSISGTFPNILEHEMEV